MSTMRTLQILIAALLTTQQGIVAQAQEYPTRAITLISPWPAGGVNDTASRLLGTELAKRLGKPVIIENRAGAGSTLGVGAVAWATPDGYTLAAAGMASLATSVAIYKKLAYVGARRAVDVGFSELGDEQMAALEDVERQVAVAAIVAVEVAALLVTVQRIIGGVEVEHDALGRPPVRGDVEAQEHLFYRRFVDADLVVAPVTRLRRPLQTIERRFAGQRGDVGALGRERVGQ